MRRKNILENLADIKTHMLIDILAALYRVYVFIERRNAVSLIHSRNKNIVLYTEHIDIMIHVFIQSDMLYEINIGNIVESFI